jgi:hypothetical protein
MLKNNICVTLCPTEKTASEIHAALQIAYGDETLSHTTFQWFKNSQTSVQDDE